MKLWCFVVSENNLQEVDDLVQVAKDDVDLPEKFHKRWGDSDILLFLSLLISKKDNVNDKKIIKRELYKQIAKDMNKNGTDYSPLQLENKLKFLTTKYKEVKDHNNQSGKDRRVWKYFDMMEEFIGDKDTVNPKAKCSSIALNQENNPCTSEEVSSRMLVSIRNN